jgi:hypothetical protein
MQIKPSLRECERAIERAAVAYAQAGTALALIRDQDLFKDTHSSFEDYCRDRWGWGKSQVYRQIDAAKVYETLAERAETSPIGDGFHPPRNEATARELVPLRSKPAQLTKVWQKVIEQHGPDAGARQVRSVVAEVLSPKEPPTSPASTYSVEDAVAALRRLIGRGFTPAVLREALNEIDRGGIGDARA